MHDRLLLDTCALLWLASGDKSLSVETLDAIEKAAIVYVSAISAWEISLKAGRGALVLPLGPREWFDAALKHHNLTLLTLDVSILIAANSLPWHHRDPADRFIIASAMAHNADIVTGDRRFIKYGVKVLV
jgi:PIN domain nuclease of toxin-antitoxin system